MQEWGEREQRELAALIKHYRKNGLWKPDASGLGEFFRDARILVKNTEANTIPAYGCMEVTGTVDESGQAFVTVKKPTSSGVLFLFNNHYEIEANGYGEAQRGPVFRCYKSSGTIVLGEKWAPTASQYYLSKSTSGRYVVYGSDDIGTDVFRVVDEDKTPRVKHVKTGGSSIAAFNEGTLTMSSGTVTEYACSSSGVLSSTSNTLTAYNPGGLIGANSYGVVEMNEAGLWVFVVVKCG